MVLQVWTKEPQQQQTGNNDNNMTTEREESGTTSPISLSSPTNSNNTAAMTTSIGKEKKKKGLLSIKSPFKFISGGSGNKTYCSGCKKKCSGEVLRVNEAYFHTQCFKCRGCLASLSQGGFFTKDRDYFCSKCYQHKFGTKCGNCNQFVEGEVVTALGKTYHQNCFTCAGCKKPFPAGERVTFTGKSCLCQRCIGQNGQNAPSKSTATPQTTPAKSEKIRPSQQEDTCAGCGEELRDGQALMALDKQYHVWCFKCKACSTLLHGEYMGKDGHPYCEKDYQSRFGVKCTYCRRFISGKVLQAGDNNHFHPTCARCTKCGDPFGDGEEMFLQGAAIWHPRCGPGPDDGGLVVNGFESSNNAANSSYSVGNHLDESASVVSGGFYGSRASSPGASLRRGPESYYDSARFSRSTMQMPGSGSWYTHHHGGLYSSSSTYSLRRPIEPGDRVDSYANISHFHLPPSRRASSSSRHHAAAVNASRMSVENLVPPAAHRPISCPPKPGYTHSARAASAAGGISSAISPGPGMHFNDFRHHPDDAISQQSFRTDMTDPNFYPGIRGSHTYSHGFRTPLPGRPQTPSIFTGEHKVYPLHMLFTNNYKLPPDLDRCNLEKHLADADFEMAFNMSRDDFYSLPLWRRNDLKRRVKLF